MQRELIESLYPDLFADDEARRFYCDEHEGGMTFSHFLPPQLLDRLQRWLAGGPFSNCLPAWQMFVRCVVNQEADLDHCIDLLWPQIKTKIDEETRGCSPMFLLEEVIARRIKQDGLPVEKAFLEKKIDEERAQEYLLDKPLTVDQLMGLMTLDGPPINCPVCEKKTGAKRQFQPLKAVVLKHWEDLKDVPPSERTIESAIGLDSRVEGGSFSRTVGNFVYCQQPGHWSPVTIQAACGGIYTPDPDPRFQKWAADERSNHLWLLRVNFEEIRDLDCCHLYYLRLAGTAARRGCPFDRRGDFRPLSGVCRETAERHQEKRGRKLAEQRTQQEEDGAIGGLFDEQATAPDDRRGRPQSGKKPLKGGFDRR